MRKEWVPQALPNELHWAGKLVIQRTQSIRMGSKQPGFCKALLLHGSLGGASSFRWGPYLFTAFTSFQDLLFDSIFNNNWFSHSFAVPHNMFLKPVWIYFTLCIWMFCLSVWRSTMYVPIGCSGNGFIDAWVPSNGCWVSNPGLLQEQQHNHWAILPSL